MATANFDVAAGISQTAANALLVEFYKNPPAADNPFKNSVQEDLSIGTVVLNWNFDAQPTLIFGPPSLDNWNQALNASGSTNQDSNKGLPSGPMVQLIAPSFTANYTLNSGTPVGGTANNVQVYGTLSWTGAPASNNITVSMVAVLLDETQFTAWDKAIFNMVLLPVIFEEAAKILQPIQMPGISWNGTALNSAWDLCFSGNTDSQLVAATTLVANSNPTSIGGIQWPVDAAFTLASKPTLAAAAAQFAQQMNKQSFGDSSQPYLDLATWYFNCTIINATVVPNTINPLTFDSSLQLKGSSGVSVSNQGLAVATKGCAIAKWLGGGGSGNGGVPDFGTTKFNYDISYSPNPVGVTLAISMNDTSLSISGSDTDFKGFSLTPDPNGQDAIGDMGSKVLTPVANLIADKYKGSVKDKILALNVPVAFNNSVEIDKVYTLTASKLALGDARMPFGDTLKITCQLDLSKQA